MKQSAPTEVLALKNQIRIFTEQRTVPNQNAEAIERLDAAIARAERELANYNDASKRGEAVLAETEQSPK